MTPTWENVSPLITGREQRGAYLYFKFTCPASGRMVQSDMIRMVEAAEGTIALTDKKNDWIYKIRIELMNLIRRFLGYNETANQAIHAVNELISDVDDGSYHFSEEQTRQAALKAFGRELVLGNFYWDAGSDRWQHKDARG